MCEYVFVCVCMCMYMCVHVYVRMCVRIHVCAHMCAHRGQRETFTSLYPPCGSWSSSVIGSGLYPQSHLTGPGFGLEAYFQENFRLTFPCNTCLPVPVLYNSENIIFNQTTKSKSAIRRLRKSALTARKLLAQRCYRRMKTWTCDALNIWGRELGKWQTIWGQSTPNY